MSEKEYICNACGKTFEEWELTVCESCGCRSCPRITGKGTCGGDVVTIEEYDEAMRINNEGG